MHLSPAVPHVQRDELLTMQRREFVAFFALNVLSGNPSINRLIRHNMQQAIYLDIALFFPSLLTGLGGLIASGAGLSVPSGTSGVGVGELFSDVMFGTLLLTLAYCAVSSFSGKEPDSIPLISQSVKDGMPTVDMLEGGTLHNEGRFIPKVPERREDNDKSDEDKK